MEIFTVLAKGVGRRDYSRAVEFASQATMKGHQTRDQLTASDEWDAVAFGDFYAYIMPFFDAEGNQVIPAPPLPYHFQSITITTRYNALILAGLCQFASLADLNAWNVEKQHGAVYGYGRAELLYTAGLKTEEGKVYGVPFGVYSEQPKFQTHLTVHRLTEEVVYG